MNCIVLNSLSERLFNLTGRGGNRDVCSAALHDNIIADESDDSQVNFGIKQSDYWKSGKEVHHTAI